MTNHLLPTCESLKEQYDPDTFREVRVAPKSRGLVFASKACVASSGAEPFDIDADDGGGT